MADKTIGSSGTGFMTTEAGDTWTLKTGSKLRALTTGGPAVAPYDQARCRAIGARSPASCSIDGGDVLTIAHTDLASPEGWRFSHLTPRADPMVSTDPIRRMQ